MQLPLNLVFLGLIASGVHGAPVFLKKRIAQVISAATADWEQACLAAGGDEQCNPLSVTAFSTLLAAPGPCEQQNAADQMIDLAKQLNNDPEMIRLTQIFVQQPRNTPSSQSVPYCEQAPNNTELNGLFQCQYAGADATVFVGGIAVGQAGTIPFGQTTPLSPAGSCPAHTSGPIADGSQLVDSVQDPGVSNTSTGTTVKPSTILVASTPASSSAASTSTSSVSSSTSTGTSASDFQLQNGKDAQALNAEFATLTAASACNTGDQACIGTSFAQCVGGKFVSTQCAATTACFALPLVNSPGTSIACTTNADAVARIAASGATGGITGNGSVTDTVDSQTASASSATAASTSTSNTAAVSTATSGNFQLQNGKDAQALNAKFATLTADSSCNAGDQACIGTSFAQCVGGKFVSTQCAAPTACFALPLVNSPGTSIACTTEADATARFEASGATGGITGTSEGIVAVASTPTTSANTVVATTSSTASGDFQLQNGKDAQTLNVEFKTLTENTACTSGDVACIGGAFAQCANGKFVVTSCAATLTCAALPLVNKPGTSVTCTTTADAAARIAATGATGGIDGA